MDACKMYESLMRIPTRNPARVTGPLCPLGLGSDVSDRKYKTITA